MRAGQLSTLLGSLSSVWFIVVTRKVNVEGYSSVSKAGISSGGGSREEEVGYAETCYSYVNRLEGPRLISAQFKPNLKFKNSIWR